MRRISRRIPPHAPRWPGAAWHWARGWRSSAWRWGGKRGLSQGQHGAQARGPEEEHPAYKTAFERAEATFEDSSTGEEAPLERREARLKLGSQFRLELLQLRLEAGEVELVQLTQLGSIGCIHLIEPIDEFVGEFVTELLVELPGQLGRHRHRILQLGSGARVRVRSARAVGNLLQRESLSRASSTARPCPSTRRTARRTPAQSARAGDPRSGSARDTLRSPARR